MFQIDRSYIEPIESLESLQGHIWDIRTDYKDDPTLPRIDLYGIGEDEFEAYLDKKQRFEDFKMAWHKNRLLIMGVTFCIPVALFSLFVRGAAAQAYMAGLLLCTLVYLVYALVKSVRARQFRNNPCETFIKALLSWELHQKG